MKEDRASSEGTSVSHRYSESVLYSGVGQVLKRAASAVAMIVVIRMLSQEDYGIYSVLLSVVPVLGMLTSWGWPSVFMRYIPALKEQGDRDMITGLVARGVLSRALIVAAAIGLIIVFYDHVGGFLNLTESREYFLIFSVGIFAYTMVQLLQVIINSHFDQKAVYQTRVLAELTKSGLFVAVLLLGFRLTGILVAETLVLVVIGFLFVRYIWKHILDRRSFSDLPRVPGKVKRYGFFGYLNDMGSFFLDISIDNLIIAKFLGVEYVAIYTVAAFSCKQMRTLVPTALLRDVLEPVTYASYARTPSDENLNRIFQHLTKVNFLVLIPIFFGIAFFGREVLVLFFGQEYAEGYPYLVGLAFFFFAERFPVAYVTKAKEQMEIVAISKVFSIYNLVMDIVLIQYFGLFGVVVATGSAQFFKQAYIYWHTKRHVAISFPAWSLGLVTLISLVTVGGLKGLQVSSGIAFPWILGVGLLLIVPFIIVLFRMEYFSIPERQSMHDLLVSITQRPRLVHRIFSVVE